MAWLTGKEARARNRLSLTKRKCRWNSPSDDWLACPLPVSDMFDVDEIIRISNDEFIVIGLDAIYKYNINDKKWVKIISDEAYQELMIGCRIPGRIDGTFDDITKRLNVAYFDECGDNDGYDLTLLTMDTHNKENKKICYNKSSYISQTVCQVKEDIHLIGKTHIDNDSWQHRIWNTVTNKMKLIASFDGDLCPKYIKLIYIQSKHIILLIGGYQQDGPNPFRARITAMGIQKFDLKTQQWTKLKEFNYCYSNAIQAGEDHVIIAAGKKICRGTKTKMVRCNDIFILNMNDEANYKLIKHNNLTMPNIGECHIVLMGNERRDKILIIGWIKELYKSKNFVNMLLPPMALQEMISQWYNQEMMHVFYNGRMDRKKQNHNPKNCHYKINMKKILKISQNGLEFDSDGDAMLDID